jgi:WD40 repeat protein
MILYDLNRVFGRSTHFLDAISTGFDLANPHCVRFTHNSSHLVVAYMDDRGVCVWDLETSKSKLQLEGRVYRLSAMDISRDDTTLVGVSLNGVTLWSLETGKIIEKYPSLGASLFIDVILSADGLLAMARSNIVFPNRVYVQYLHDDVPGVRLESNQSKLTSIACSHTNPQQVIAGSEDCSVKLWTVPTSESWLGRMPFPSLATSPLPSYVLSSSLTPTFIGHHESVSTVAFSPDDRWIASGSLDGSVRLWDPRDGTLVFLLYGHRGKSG